MCSKAYSSNVLRVYFVWLKFHVDFFRSVTSRNENWTHFFLDKMGVAYQLLKLTKSSLSQKTHAKLWPDGIHLLYSIVCVCVCVCVCVVWCVCVCVCACVCVCVCLSVCL